jgi:hypothetical protein
LEVGRTDRDLESSTLRVNDKAVEEDPDDWVLGRCEGCKDVGVSKCATGTSACSSLEIGNLEVADLELGVGAGNEVDSDARPYGGGKGELELSSDVSNREWLDGKVVASGVLNGETLEG